jgi:hypothetical protein
MFIKSPTLAQMMGHISFYSIYSFTISLWYILILSRHVHLGLTNGLHTFYFSEIVYAFLVSPVRTVTLSP